LSIDECQLRDKDWVELVPKYPDVDVVSAKFFDFKGRNAKTKTFAPKKGAEVYLCISYEKYDAILTHLSELDFNELEGQQVCYFWSCSTQPE